jgi:aldose 1-epimerase
MPSLLRDTHRASRANGVRIEQDTFGAAAHGEAIDRFTIANDSIELQTITYGGIITSLRVPDRSGARGDVVLGFDSLDAYERESPYFGAIIGRYANRIAFGRFTLDGLTHQLATNDGAHHLHGGWRGFDKRVWQANPFQRADCVGVRFSRVSESGEEQYPGALSAHVTYSIDQHPGVTIEYEATTSAATIVNMTQHTYFDLSAGAAQDVLDHVLMIRARSYTPVDATLIPTGVIAPVGETPFDFLAPHPIGLRIDADDAQLAYGGGYDHNWVLDDRRGDRPAAMVQEPHSGRTLRVWTTEPGLQFYSGNRLNIAVGKNGRGYSPRAGFCLETQHFPDSPSHSSAPSTVLRPGQHFRSRTIWTFGCD